MVVKMREQYPSEMQDRVMVRLPDGMRDKLKAAAKASGRTMNAEIVRRLEISFGEIEKRLADLAEGVNTVADLADDTHNLGSDTRGAAMMALGGVSRVLEHLGLAPLSEDDIKVGYELQEGQS